MNSLSIVIPTCNRAETLRDTLDSLLAGCGGQEDLEVLVIDNGSTDHTRAVVTEFAVLAPFPVLYHYAPCPGLHVGRNLGAQLAQGDILAYLDDDVIVQPGWAAAIYRRFALDSSIVLAGGPCRPLWEEEPPTWLEAFRTPMEGGWHMGVLSLIDLGLVARPVSGCLIFGCNFIVRKEIVLRCNGFHPDGVPDDLLRYRGDGESGLGQTIDSMPGATAFYDPDIAILHRIPAKRLTQTYLLYVAARTGYGNAYALFRKFRPRGILGRVRLLLSEGLKVLSIFCKSFGIPHRRATNSPTPTSWYNLLLKAQMLHLAGICLSPELARWVCQDSYFEQDPCPYWPVASRNGND